MKVKIQSNELRLYFEYFQLLNFSGYLVLAGRVRKPEESEIVLKALQKHIKKKVDINNLFTCTNFLSLCDLCSNQKKY